MKTYIKSDEFMASFLNNVFVVDEGSWLGDAAADEVVDLEPFADAGDGGDESDPEDSMPDVIGILPIRNTVAYPGTIVPLAVGRERSKTLLTEAEPNATVIGLLTQRDPDIDAPGFDDLYSVGTTASVLVMTGQSATDKDAPVVPAPKVLQ